jgi:LytR cell envelope-related transcriptional attenuator
MSRQQRGNGGGSEVARGAGYAAFLGAGLIAVAVIIGVVLLQIGDKNDNGPASAAKPHTTTTTTTRPKTSTTKPHTPTQTTPPRTPNAVSVIVLNGGAASGRAGDMDAFLKTKGYTNQGVPTDWSGHRQTGNSVYCRAGLNREGVALAATVGSGVKLITPYPVPGPPSSASHDCVVVVGAAT